MKVGVLCFTEPVELVKQRFDLFFEQFTPRGVFTTTSLVRQFFYWAYAPAAQCCNSKQYISFKRLYAQKISYYASQKLKNDPRYKIIARGKATVWWVYGEKEG